MASLDTLSLATSLSTIVVTIPFFILSNYFLVIITGFGQACPLASTSILIIIPP